MPRGQISSNLYESLSNVREPDVKYEKYSEQYLDISIKYSGKYSIKSDRDRTNARLVNEFISTCEAAFERDMAWGHITASAFILNSNHDHILLTHHAKLDRWLPLGGHCDGIKDPRFIALKEAYEESGLTQLRYMRDDVFDIDVHDIPASADMPTHKHLDIRYLFEADMAEPLRPTSESKALVWLKLDLLEVYTSLHSVLIVKQKLVMP
ncbi:NUDIX hydrolase [Agrobacterium rhizogenes]|nr:NUDIX hydrolase [Rhizobium rhizogenes]